MPSRVTSLVWFRQDLRLADNPALTVAARGGPVVPVFVWSPRENGAWPPGGASRWWLHHSLLSLRSELQSRGSDLVVRAGESLATLLDLARSTQATAIHWNRLTEPALADRDERIAEDLRRHGIQLHTHQGSFLCEPGTVLTTTRKPYTVFTPFAKACLDRISFGDALSTAPATLPAPNPLPPSAPIDDLRLLDPVDWAAGLRATWRPGAAEALRCAQDFASENVNRYKDERDRPDLDTTSHLSAHLHFGEISPARLWSIADEAAKGAGSRHAPAIRSFQRQLLWREFAQHLLKAFPQTPELPLREEFSRFPWHDAEEQLSRWERGLTGYPIVDAGMRQLWQIGWMHNRVRMIVASFLTKDLLVSWTHGARWFWDTLVDADLANNTLGWQWTAGCGADAAPYFRVFNPVLQGRRFDPDGTYVRRWLPEIAAFPTAFVHEPWKAPPDVLHDAGVALRHTYPQRIVEHDVARIRALEAYGRIRSRTAATY